jgi:hypothetical protein
VGSLRRECVFQFPPEVTLFALSYSIAMMRVKLGIVGSQPLETKVLGGALTIRHPMTPVTGKLPAIEERASALAIGQVALGAAIAAYVPDSTTAEGWVKEFEEYAASVTPDSPAPTAAHFADFTAMVYYRTTLPHGTKGRLEVSSACTYLRYVVAKYKKFSALPAFRAVETEAASKGAQRKAPSAGDDLVAVLKGWFASGPQELPARPTLLQQKAMRTRLGAWLQTTTGGRCIDVSQLRSGGVKLRAGGREGILSVEWRWTKTIKKPVDAKAVFPPPRVNSEIGPMPCSEKQWLIWAKDPLFRPFEGYCSADVNVELKALSAGFTEAITSTSLRDVYNRLIAEVCDNDQGRMVRYTPHKSAKSIAGSYLVGRTISVPKIAKKEIKGIPKKTKK